MKFFSVDERVIIAGRKEISGAFGTGMPAFPADEAYHVCPFANSGSDSLGPVFDLIRSVGECQKLIADFIAEGRIATVLIKMIEAARSDFDPDTCLKTAFSESVQDPEKSPVSESPETSENLSQAPKNYRGWNLTSRGKNKKGESLFNLAKTVRGKKQQKYLGVWNQEKADRIIDEMS